jgi:type I restriction enzyme S subunit
MNDSTLLKPGWTWVKFGDVVRLNTDRCADPAGNGIERYVGLEHIEPEDLRIRRWGLVAEGTTFTNRFQPGQVLFGKRRAYQRKVAVADFAGVCSGDIYVFEPKDERLLPELLPFLCQTESFFEYAVGTSAGSLSPRTNWTQLANYEFALPPLEEQRRIIITLQNASELLDSYRDLCEKANIQYLSAIIHLFQNGVKGGIIMEQNKLSYPADWQLLRIDSCFHLQLGKMSSAKSREGANHQLYLKNNNVLWGEFDFSELSSMSFDEEEQKKFALKKGDLLVCEGGEIGRAAVWNEEYPGLFYQKAIHRLRPKSDKHSTELLMHYLRYCSLRGILNSIATGTTITHLPAEKLAALTLPFPPEEEQKVIVNILNNNWQAVKLIQSRVNAALETYKALLTGMLEG